MSSQTQLTDQEIEIISDQFKLWHEREVVHRAVLPVVQKDGWSGYEEIWHKVPAIPPPSESRDLTNVETALAALVPASANIVFHAYVLELPWTLVQAARNGKFDIREISYQAAAKQMALKESFVAFRGSTRPSISGLFASAGAESTATGAGKLWETAPGAVNVVADMMAQMPEYDPPFELVIASNARTGIKKFINSTPTGPWLQEDAIKNLIGGSIHYVTYEPASPSKKKIYPFPAPTAQHASALLMKAGPDTAELIIEQPLKILEGPFDTYRGIFPLLAFQAMTLRVWDANAICKHTQIQFS